MRLVNESSFRHRTGKSFFVAASFIPADDSPALRLPRKQTCCHVADKLATIPAL